jgi:hypothetical protein
MLSQRRESVDRSRPARQQLYRRIPSPVDAKPLREAPEKMGVSHACVSFRVFFTIEKAAPLVRVSPRYLSGGQHDAGVRSKQKNAGIPLYRFK